MRTRRRSAEVRGEAVGHLVGEPGRQTLRLLVGAGPVQPEGVGEPALQQPVMADHLRGERLAGGRRRDAPIVREFVTHPSRWSRWSVVDTVGALTPCHSAIRPGRTTSPSWAM